MYDNPLPILTHYMHTTYITATSHVVGKKIAPSHIFSESCPLGSLTSILNPEFTFSEN